MKASFKPSRFYTVQAISYLYHSETKLEAETPDRGLLLPDSNNNNLQRLPQLNPHENTLLNIHKCLLANWESKIFSEL